ncbi:unnamed protein product [Prorocentrum cordatum]|uniref:Uncharacterized protein n=1 Tax=Prorocentrum cordatum TaxID=2364126 RepID=A0ABN9WRY7_9DINO|nr:unnamed protein product [Polarella glacialis]
MEEIYEQTGRCNDCRGHRRRAGCLSSRTAAAITYRSVRDDDGRCLCFRLPPRLVPSLRPSRCRFAIARPALWPTRAVRAPALHPKKATGARLGSAAAVRLHGGSPPSSGGVPCRSRLCGGRAPKPRQIRSASGREARAAAESERTRMKTRRKGRRKRDREREQTKKVTLTNHAD